MKDSKHICECEFSGLHKICTCVECGEHWTNEDGDHMAGNPSAAAGSEREAFEEWFNEEFEDFSPIGNYGKVAWAAWQAARTAAPPNEQFPIPLNADIEALCAQWAADDRLWTTQDTVAFNLRTFSRAVIAASRAENKQLISATEAAAPAPLSCLMCGQIGEVAIKHEPSGCYVCMKCRERAAAPAPPSREKVLDRIMRYIDYCIERDQVIVRSRVAALLAYGEENDGSI